VGMLLKKMREIINKAQGGNSAIISTDLIPGRHTFSIKAQTGGDVKEMIVKT